MFRPWFALLTALLFGATLSAPITAGEGVYQPTKLSLSVAADTAVSLLDGTDSDSEDVNHTTPLVLLPQSDIQPGQTATLRAFAVRFAELPPARASPANL